MVITLFMAATAGAYAWYVHGWFWAVLVGLAMVTLVPRILWELVKWRIERLPDADTESLVGEYKVARRLSWWTWVGVLLLIAMTGSLA